jgi:hypothetical protein
VRLAGFMEFIAKCFLPLTFFFLIAIKMEMWNTKLTVWNACMLKWADISRGAFWEGCERKCQSLEALENFYFYLTATRYKFFNLFCVSESSKTVEIFKG